MIRLYNFVLSTISYVALPLSSFILEKEQRANRRGKKLPNKENVIWIHAASMGEVNAVKPFILALEKKVPHKNIVISTMTKTGQEAAKKISDNIDCFYLPFDTKGIIRRTFNTLKPQLIIIAETELWPNMLLRAKTRNIPVEIINGRISKKSFKTYLKTKFFWSQIISHVHVNAKSRSDQKRFMKIGFTDVIDAGNLKFCLHLPNYNRSQVKQELGFSLDDKIIVWGSSRPGEELILKEISKHLFTKFPDLKIVIAPRHLQRVDEVCQLFDDVTLSNSSDKISKINIVNEMGKLTKYYAISDIAVIGGSFVDFGGHNPLESAYYGIPTVIGNFHHSCRDSVRILKKVDGIIVSNKDKLLEDLIHLLSDENFAKKTGLNGKIALAKNQASLELNLKRSLELLAE